MKVQFLNRIGCYFVRTNTSAAYLVNFDTNRIIQVSIDFDQTVPNISDAYFKILRSEGITVDGATDFCTNSRYKPTSVTFLMTTRCNLNCRYCYAYNHYNADLSFSYAKIAIDFIVKNAVDDGNDKITIRFHGLGEPTQNFEVLKQIVKYAKKECAKKSVSPVFHITSNGVMKDYQREYIIKNIDFITLSIDGTAPYQNAQRPLLNGDSFSEAIKTLDAVEDKNRLLIRTTVTNFSLKNLEEWCDFLTTRGVKNINVEPVIVCGNCQNNGITDLDNSFCNEFRMLQKNFPEMKISYSCFHHGKGSFHCGACSTNMVVTPFNDVSTCYECYDVADKAQSLFIVGKIENGNVHIDQDKVDSLKATCQSLRKECSKCFSQSFCKGSCFSKRYKSLIAEGNSSLALVNKCKITKRIVMDKLAERLSTKISFTQAETLFV